MLNVAFLASRIDYNDGVASHLELLASQLRGSKIQLTMFTGCETGERIAARRKQALRDLFAGWINLDTSQLATSIRNLRSLRRHLKAGRFDIVHVHGLGMLPLARLSSLGLRSAVVATYHPSAHGETSSDFKLRMGWRRRTAYSVLLRVFKPDRIIALSSETYDLFATDFHVDRTHIRKILCGIDAEYYRPPTQPERAEARSRFGFGDDDLVCVLAGRLNLNKGHDVAIKAIDRLPDSVARRVRVVFAGAGAQESTIRDLVSASRYPHRYTITGFVRDMREVYWASDIVLLPSRTEGFGIVVAEAMASGCAPIRTPSGGASDQIREGETGYVVGFNDPDALARSICGLADTDVRRRISERAASHSRTTFSGARLGNETRHLYADLRSPDDSEPHRHAPTQH